MSLKEFVKRITVILKTIGGVRFWATVIVLVPTLTCVTYYLSGVVIEGDLPSKYKALDPLAKQFVSIEGWWMETLIGGCTPMFLVFSIQFFLLKKEISTENRTLIFSALPFIPKLNWLTNKPIIFLLGTSSVFLGMTLFLGLEGESKYLWSLFIPFFLFLLTFYLRYAASVIASGKGFAPFTYRHCAKIGWFSIGMSFLCWFYADIFLPAQDVWGIWQAIKS